MSSTACSSVTRLIDRFSHAFAMLLTSFRRSKTSWRAIAFDHPQIGALDFFVGGEAKGALQTNAAAADAGTIARLARIDDFVITKSALWTTHSVRRSK